MTCLTILAAKICCMHKMPSMHIRLFMQISHVCLCFIPRCRFRIPWCPAQYGMEIFLCFYSLLYYSFLWLLIQCPKDKNNFKVLPLYRSISIVPLLQYWCCTLHIKTAVILIQWYVFFLHRGHFCFCEFYFIIFQ